MSANPPRIISECSLCGSQDCEGSEAGAHLRKLILGNRLKETDEVCRFCRVLAPNQDQNLSRIANELASIMRED
jgi:hypothetical protein